MHHTWQDDIQEAYNWGPGVGYIPQLPMGL